MFKVKLQEEIATAYWVGDSPTFGIRWRSPGGKPVVLGYFSLGLPVAFKVSVDWPCLVVSVIDVPLGSMFSRVSTVIPIVSISVQGSMLYIIVPSSASAWSSAPKAKSPPAPGSL